jgi:site-specific DNA-methyltransferase (adenine-specific)
MDQKLVVGHATRNPDVLTCIANLSNDEVFTPPEFANTMLDSLTTSWAQSNKGQDLWTNSSATFLDPCTKSGVFLREIVKRLNKGLAAEIPELNTRINHILTKQVFGIGITRLTALLARRSVYCSKRANGKHSIGTTFLNDFGNIWYEPLDHSWVGGQVIETSDKSGNLTERRINGKCSFCGASQKVLDREVGLETHAYSFIHSNNIQQQLATYFGAEMQFDVIIGNPPYQLNDGGGSGTSAAPIYNKFVTQAKALDPRLISMVIPARWFSGGKGLDEFRSEMLNDSRIRVIEDFPDSNDVFPGTQIKGGVCYFIWDRDNPGDCQVTTHDNVTSSATMTRPLLEPGTDIFIRYNEAIPILQKIMKVENDAKGNELALSSDKQFMSLVSARRPFGDIDAICGKDGDITVYVVGGIRHAKRKHINTGIEFLDSWKIFIPFLGSGSDSFPHPILGKPFIGSPGTATSETNLAIGPFESESEARNAASYISTRFFRFLVLQRKPSQNATRKVYGFVPKQDFSKSWTDEMLYKKYHLSKSEKDFIEQLIRPMELPYE